MAELSNWEKIQQREKTRRTSGVATNVKSPWEKIQERDTQKRVQEQQVIEPSQSTLTEKQTFSEAVKKPVTLLRNIFGGATDIKTEDTPIVGGIEVGVKAGLVLQSLRSVERGFGTKADIQRLRNYQKELDEEAQKNLSSGYRIGSGIKSSLVFGAEIALALAGAAAAPFSGGTSATATAGAVGSVAGKKAALELVEKTAKNRIKDALVSNAKKVGWATALTSPSHVPANTLKRMVGDYTITPEDELIINQEGQDFSEATINAVSSHIVEVGGEIAFGKALDSLGTGAKNQLFKTAFLKEFASKNKNVPRGFASNLLEKANINSLVGEMGEEELQNLTNGILAEMGLGDQKYTMPTTDDLAERLLTFGGIKLAAGVVDRVIKQTMKEEADKMTPSETEERYSKLTTAVKSRIESGVSPLKISAELSKTLDVPLYETDLIVEKAVKEIVKERKEIITEAVTKDDIENEQMDRFIELTRPKAIQEPAVKPDPVITPDVDIKETKPDAHEAKTIPKVIKKVEDTKPVTKPTAEQVKKKIGTRRLVERFKKSKVQAIAEGFVEEAGEYDVLTDEGQMKSLNKIITEDKDPVGRLMKIIESGEDTETKLRAGIVLQEINNGRIDIPITEELLNAMKSFTKKATEAGRDISSLRNIEKHNFSKQVEILQKVKEARFAKKEGQKAFLDRDGKKTREASEEIVKSKKEGLKEKSKSKKGQKKLTSNAWAKLVKELQC